MPSNVKKRNYEEYEKKKHIDQSSWIVVTIIADLAIRPGRIYVRVYCPPREQRFPETVLLVHHFMSSSAVIFRRQTVGLSFGNDKICSIL